MVLGCQEAEEAEARGEQGQRYRWHCLALVLEEEEEVRRQQREPYEAQAGASTAILPTACPSPLLREASPSTARPGNPSRGIAHCGH